MFQPTEDSQIRSIRTTLMDRYEGRLPPAQVPAEVDAVVEALHDALHDARVRTFVPVLVQRRATDRLRQLERQSA